jgi:hypothetical protein
MHKEEAERDGVLWGLGLVMAAKMVWRGRETVGEAFIGEAERISLPTHCQPG